MNEQKKIILFVISSLGGGGAERVLLHLLKGLDSMEVQIIVCTLEEQNDYQYDFPSHVKIISLNKKNRWQFLNMIFRIRVVIDKFKPDIVFSSLYYTNIIVGLASWMKKRNFKLIFSEHSYPGTYLNQTRFKMLKRKLMQLTYQKADLIVSVSALIKKYLVDTFKLTCDQVTCIYNPVDIKNICIKSQEPVSHHFWDGSKNIVFIGAGRLVKEKRFDRLLRCFKEVHGKYIQTRLLILGKGPLLEDLKKLAQNLHIEKVVDFVGFQSNPYKWLAKADIFVLSSDQEGFPLILLEAMCCETAIVSIDCPSGPNEIIIHNKNGLLVPINDEHALKNSMIKLILDDSLRKFFAQEGKKKVENFSTVKIIPQYQKIFNTNLNIPN